MTATISERIAGLETKAADAKAAEYTVVRNNNGEPYHDIIQPGTKGSPEHHIRNSYLLRADRHAARPAGEAWAVAVVSAGGDVYHLTAASPRGLVLSLEFRVRRHDGLAGWVIDRVNGQRCWYQPIDILVWAKSQLDDCGNPFAADRVANAICWACRESGANARSN